MSTWRIELDPSPEPLEGPRTRYVVYREAANTPLFHLDNRDAEDLTDALIEALRPIGYQVGDPRDVPPPRVCARVKGDRVKIGTPARVAMLPKVEARALFEALAHELGRRGEEEGGNMRAVAWQCRLCNTVANAAPGPEPASPGCDNDRQHEWYREVALGLAGSVEAELPGFTATVFRDGEARSRRATGFRVDDPQGDPVGVVLVTDTLCDAAPLDMIAETASRVAELLRNLREDGQSGRRYIEVGEHGVRLRDR